MFRNILVPIDLSDDSRLAAHHAAALANRSRGQITLLHVDEVAGHGLASSGALAIHMEQAKEVRDAWFGKVNSELAQYGVDIKVARAIGSAAREILDTVESDGIDLVVMGRRGLGGIERMLIGSTSKRVVKHAAVPVLVVPAGDVPPDGPVTAVPWHRIIAPTDFSEASGKGIRALAKLGAEYDIEAVALHVAHVPMIAAAAGEPPFVLPMETRGELQKAAEDELDREMVKLGMPPMVRRIATVATSVPHAIIEFAERENADVIAVPSHGKGAFRRMLFGSTTLRMVALSPLPLLVLPRQWLDAQDA